MNRIRPLHRRRLRSPLLSAVAALALASAVAPAAIASGIPSSAPSVAGSSVVAATTAVPVPPVPAGLPAGIEGLSPYVPATGCDLRVRTGSSKLAQLIKATYANTYGLARTCTSATSASSEHFDGRSVDTFFNVRDAGERADASALLNWLFAKDAAGNPYANARRLGIMYIIWNNKIWGAYSTSDGWRPYSSCASTPTAAYDTTCHRNHIHISLSWEGAEGRTSFWTKKVAPVDWGPCRPADLNWSEGQVASPNPRRCATYPRVVAPTGASSLLKEMVPRSGMVLRPGMSGPAVVTLQKVIGVSPATGNFGSITTARLKSWQTSHGVAAYGIAYPSTWRAMLKAQGMYR